MSPRRSFLVLLMLGVALVGCAAPEATPPEVEAEYHELLAGLDAELPGAAVERLRAFRNRNKGYEIAAEVDAEIERFRFEDSGRYHLARELAREGDFDRARRILEDLAIYQPDTTDGESARRYLEGDFEVSRVQWLAARGRWEESQEAARSLLERGVASPQAEQLETILDGAAMVDSARALATRTQAMAACRQTMMVLEVQMADRGEYPETFSLADVETYDPVGSRGIRRSLSAIEDYARTAVGYDLVCVGADGQSRIRVVDGTLER